MSWFKRKEERIEKKVISINDEDIDIVLKFDGVEYNLKDQPKSTTFDQVYPKNNYTRVYMNIPLPIKRQRGIKFELIVDGVVLDIVDGSETQWGHFVMKEYTYSSTSDYNYRFEYEPINDDYSFDFKIENSYEFKSERTKKLEKKHKLDCAFEGLSKEEIVDYLNKIK